MVPVTPQYGAVTVVLLIVLPKMFTSHLAGLHFSLGLRDDSTNLSSSWSQSEWVPASYIRHQ